MGTRTKEVSVGQRKFQFRPDNILHLTRECQAELQAILGKWETAFAPEETWVHNTLGKPSIIVRFDLALAPDRPLRNSIYEIEERPAGLGATTLTNPFFNESFRALRQKWEGTFGEKNIPVLVMRPAGGGHHSDHEWIDIKDLNKFYQVFKEWFLIAAKRKN